MVRTGLQGISLRVPNAVGGEKKRPQGPPSSNLKGEKYSSEETYLELEATGGAKADPTYRNPSRPQTPSLHLSKQKKTLIVIKSSLTGIVTREPRKSINVLAEVCPGAMEWCGWAWNGHG